VPPGAYVPAAGDVGQAVMMNAGGVTLNPNVFSAGDVITLVNYNATQTTIFQGIGFTLIWADTPGTTGNRILDAYSICTVFFVSNVAALISGSGVL